MMLETLFAGFFVLQILDALTTHHIIASGGKELNPPLAWTFDKLGVIPGLLLIKGAAIGVAYWLFSAGNIDALLIVDVLYVAVVIHNIQQVNG